MSDGRAGRRVPRRFDDRGELGEGVRLFLRASTAVVVLVFGGVVLWFAIDGFFGL